MNRATSKFVLAAFLLSLAPAVPAANEQHRVVEASADGTVSIFNTAGSITVVGWSRNEVDVTADLGWGVEELIVERDGDDVLVKVKVPRENARNVSSELTVRVPERSAIDAAAVSADIDVVGVFGEQRLHTVSGDIVSEVFEAEIEMEAVSGDIELEGDRRPSFAKLSTVSGDIGLTNLGGDLEASSVSGDLIVAESSFQRARVDTVNGDIIIRVAIADGGRLDVETINGDIDLEFEGAIAGRFDIETFNGSIDNCFGPEPQRTSQYTPGRELKFSEGDSNTRIVIRTLNGGLRMCRD